MVEKRISNFIFSSSHAIYGEPLEIPISEKHSKNPINPYGRSKWIPRFADLGDIIDTAWQWHKRHSDGNED